MARLNEGDVEITLDGDQFTLRPTLRAMNQISSMGGLAKVRQAIVDQDFSTVVSVVLYGANLAGKAEAKQIPDKVYANGLDAALLVPLINFLAILANGGKPLPEHQDDQLQLSAEGNGS
jgi:hypothetical protein